MTKKELEAKVDMLDMKVVHQGVMIFALARILKVKPKKFLEMMDKEMNDAEYVDEMTKETLEKAMGGLKGLKKEILKGF